MKRITILTLVFFCAVLTKAQVAQWLIPPVYEKISIPAEGNVIITDSARTKTLWSMKGERLVTVSDMLYPYSEGYAVSSRYDAPYITAIYDKDGHPIKPVKDYQLGHGYPYFHNGHLLVFDGRNYRFMDTEGNVSQTGYARAYPFSGGYASCYTYENMAKKKSPYYLLIDKDLRRVNLQVNGKVAGMDDVEFISSVNDEGLAVIVIKHKLYYFVAESRELRPVFATPEENDLKNQAKVDGDLSLSSSSDSTVVLKAKCGRAGAVEVIFNEQMKPIAFKNETEMRPYATKPRAQRDFSSMLKKHLGDDGKLALYWGDREMLPPQFTTIPLCFDDKAFLRIDDKYGMIQVHPEDHFQVSLNKGKPMAFRHQRFETTARIDMPPYVQSGTTSLIIDPQTGCVIDNLTRETNNTQLGNYVQYACEVGMPEGISDELEEFEYPAQVVYGGLRAPLQVAKAQAWHYKYYNVDVNERETSIANGTLAFTIDISAERLQGEDIYPYEVKLLTDSLSFDMEQVSAIRYKCKVYNLKTGTNNVIVQIIEDGCPPANYTFEVEYTKPTAHAGGDKVVMKKKKKPENTRPSTPHLEI